MSTNTNPRHIFNVCDLTCLKCGIHLSIQQMEARPCTTELPEETDLREKEENDDREE